MRPLLYVLVISTLCMSPAAHAADWWFVNGDQNSIELLDRASVVDSASGERAWTMLIYQQPQLESGVYVARELDLYAYRCSDRNVELRQLLYYGTDNSLLLSWTEPAATQGQSWEEVGPGTVGEALVDIICNGDAGVSRQHAARITADPLIFAAKWFDFVNRRQQPSSGNAPTPSDAPAASAPAGSFL